jgi:hypothetical protein
MEGKTKVDINPSLLNYIFSKPVSIQALLTRRNIEIQSPQSWINYKIRKIYMDYKF